MRKLCILEQEELTEILKRLKQSEELLFDLLEVIDRERPNRLLTEVNENVKFIYNFLKA